MQALHWLGPGEPREEASLCRNDLSLCPVPALSLIQDKQNKTTSLDKTSLLSFPALGTSPTQEFLTFPQESLGLLCFLPHRSASLWLETMNLRAAVPGRAPTILSAWAKHSWAEKGLVRLETTLVYQ